VPQVEYINHHMPVPLDRDPPPHSIMSTTSPSASTTPNKRNVVDSLNKTYVRLSSSDHIVIPISINDSATTPPSSRSSAMIDSGATSNFIHPEMVKKLKLKTQKKKIPIRLMVIDDRPISSGIIEDETQVELVTGKHREIITLDIASIGKHPVILGLPWLHIHNPSIDWSSGRILFSSLFCSTSCLTSPPDVASLPHGRPVWPKPSVEEVEDEDGDLIGVSHSYPMAEILATNEDTSPRDHVPAHYRDFADVFSKKESERLPPHRSYDCRIDLKPGEPLPKPGTVYPMNPSELAELKLYLEEQLRKGYIKPSKSPVAAPCFYINKKDGSRRLVIDYRQLNEKTIRNEYPLPLTHDIIDQLKGAKVFTKMDLRWGYNLVRIAPGHEWKTAFKTRYGLYEWAVMSFGLTNAPAVFQYLMNDIFHDLLDVCVIIYLDDILVYSTDPSKHHDQVREVLRRLQENELFVKPEKCVFDAEEVEFLGMKVSGKGVEMSEDKVEAVLEWPAPSNVKEVQSFLGFANFYRRFINGFSRIAKPLTKLTRKDHPWMWNELAAQAFEELKKAFTTAPVLIHPDTQKPFTLETDASNFAYGACLSQKGEDGKLHPVAFLSKSMSPAELNYDIYDKEMLAVVRSLQAWRHYLEGSSQKIDIITDHKNLEYFATAKKLSPRQLRWIQELSRFNFIIHYRPGLKHEKVDALSRRFDHHSKEGGEIPQALLRSDQFASISATHAPDHEIIALIEEEVTNDPMLKPIIAYFENNPEEAPANVQDKMKEYSWEQGLLFFRNKVVVPASAEIKRMILALRHDSLLAGHPGQAKTLELVNRDYYWPSMKAYVNKYVDGCQLCQRTKPIHQKPVGLLQPLPIPDLPWQSISYDDIPALPPSKGFNCITNVVDRNTGYAHFIRTTTNTNAAKKADEFLDHVWKLHGLPLHTVSDRGSVFNSQLMRAIYKRLGIKPSFSTAYHPQTDGKTERINQSIEQYLRLFCNHAMDNWSDLLPLAEFTYNNTVNASTGLTPFFANYGYHPVFTTIPGGSGLAEANDRIKVLKDLQKELKASMEVAQETQKRNYDRNQRLGPKLKEGDMVWLESTNITTDRPSHKLSHRRLGPFPIETKLSDLTYRLTLPRSMKMHPVFHIGLLTPLRQDEILNRPQARVPVPIAKAADDWVVTRVKNSRWQGDQLMYEVRWKGRPADEDSEVPYDDIKDYGENLERIREFHEANPEAWSLTKKPTSRSGRVTIPRRRA